MKLKDLPDLPSIEVAPAKMFDGRFFLTNPYDFSHICRWNNTEYEFKAGTTSPLFIAEANPLETESIRKKFAVEIGTAAFMKSKEYKVLAETEKKTKGAGIPTYEPIVTRDQSGNEVLNDRSPIAPYVQRCLEPLPIVPAKVRTPKKEKDNVRFDPKTGRAVITVMNHEDNQSRSLIEEASRL